MVNYLKFKERTKDHDEGNNDSPFWFFKIKQVSQNFY